MKNKFNFDNVFLVCCIVLSTLFCFCFFSFQSLLAYFCSVFGMLSFKFASNGKWISFIFDILSYFVYIFICFNQKYFGELFLSGFVIIMYLFTLFEWKRNEENGRVKINKLKNKEVLSSLFTAIIILICYFFILKLLKSEYPFINAIMTVSFLLGNYFSLKRSILQFYFWILYEIIFIGLWFVSAITGEISFGVFLIDGICELVFGIIGIINFKKDSNTNYTIKSMLYLQN